MKMKTSQQKQIKKSTFKTDENTKGQKDEMKMEKTAL